MPGLLKRFWTAELAGTVAHIDTFNSSATCSAAGVGERESNSDKAQV